MEDLITHNHDDRNERHWGKENQQKLYNTSALVVGSGILAQMTAGCLAGISVGNLYVCDNKRISRYENDFLCLPERDNTLYVNQEKVYYICDILKQINSEIKIKPIYSKFSEARIFPKKPDIIIDATNESDSKKESFSYAYRYQVPYISISSKGDKGVISCFKQDKKSISDRFKKYDLDSLIHKEFHLKPQGSITSGVMSGLAVEELRKFLFSLRDDGLDNNILDCKPVYYNLFSSKRNQPKNDISPVYIPNHKNKKVLVVGAGALGNFAALNLALSGFENIDIIDGDKIDETNLNRQILFYQKVNKPKVNIIKERLNELSNDININVFNKYLTENDSKLFEDSKYDLILGCLDNGEARQLVDRFAEEYNIPYIDGGTTPSSGQVAIFYPDKTPKITKRLNFPKKKNSCLDQSDPSVVMSNIIIGSAMVGEAFQVLNKSSKEQNLQNIFGYNAFNQNRLYIRR